MTPIHFPNFELLYLKKKNSPCVHLCLRLKYLQRYQCVFICFCFCKINPPWHHQYHDFCIVSSMYGNSQNITLLFYNFWLSNIHSRGAIPWFCSFPICTTGSPQIIFNLILINPKKQWTFKKIYKPPWFNARF